MSNSRKKIRLIDATQPIRFEEASSPNEPYSFIDSEGREVTVCAPNPENHTPHGVVTSDPAIFQNVGFAVRNYDFRKIKNRDNRGESVTYTCTCFYDKIDHPNRHTKNNFSLTIGVYYSSNGDNYTRTFYDEPGDIL